MDRFIETLAVGLAHHRCGRLAAAEAAYRQVLAEDEDQPNALHLYGVLLSERGDAAPAIALLARAVRQRPADTESLLALANLHYRNGDAAKACVLWQAVLAIAAGHLGAALNLAGSQRAAGAWRDAVDTCRRALEAQPLSATLWEALGSCLLAGQVMAAAVTAADAALELDPSRAEAWLVRGTALARLRQMEPALAALRRACALAPGDGRAALHLGNALLGMDLLEEAEAQIRRAVLLAPGLAEAHTSLGFLEVSRYRIAEGIACHERAIALRPDFAEAHSNLAAALLLAGDYARGFAEYEWRKHNTLFAACYWQSDRPAWVGEDLAGRTILVFCEQGLGDTLMCARYLRVLAAQGAQIVLVCAPPLIPLLGGLPGVVAVVPRGEPLSGERVAPGAAVPVYDFWIDQMSLPRVLGTTITTVPYAAGYLRAEPALVQQWRARRGAGVKVGVVWAGSPAHSNDHRRSMRGSEVAPLIAALGERFVSLQCGPAGEGRDGASPALGDFAETAALVAGLDLVIAVDTAVAHLAGALGVPCWLMLPYVPEWRWLLSRDDTPWYGSVRLFRQSERGDWAGLVARVVAALPELASASSRET